VTRRLRSVSQRLEGIEDALDRLDERVAGVGGGSGEDRLGRMEARLDEITRDIAALAELLAPTGGPMPRAQERLTVTDS
jgi:hypothetical protein